MKELEQGSEEWLELRKKHVTGSDAAVVMGLSPWQTPLALWEYKMDIRPPEPLNRVMLEGQAYEAQARHDYELQTGHLMLPSVLKSYTEKFMMASLDGINFEKDRIVEIKCGKATYRDAQKNKIATYYHAQMQHCMHVANVDVCDFFAWRPNEKPILIEVKRDEKFCEKMLESERLFYQRLVDGVAPDSTDSDVTFIKDEESLFRKLEFEWHALDKEIKNLEEARDNIRGELIGFADGKSCEGRYCRVRRFHRKGNIQYAKIPELKDVDLEQYRAKGSHQYRLTTIENEWE